MSDKRDATNVAKFAPRPSVMEATVKRLALDSSNVRWKSQHYMTHAASRMDWRDITDHMMFEVLRSGYIKGDMEPGKNTGEWKLKMCKKLKGMREIGVVTVVINEEKLFIITVEWEDQR